MGTIAQPLLLPCDVTCTVKTFNVLLPPQLESEQTVVTTVNGWPALVMVSVVEAVLRLASLQAVFRSRSNRCWATVKARARSLAPAL